MSKIREFPDSMSLFFSPRGLVTLGLSPESGFPWNLYILLMCDRIWLSDVIFSQFIRKSQKAFVSVRFPSILSLLQLSAGCWDPCLLSLSDKLQDSDPITVRGNTYLPRWPCLDWLPPFHHQIGQCPTTGLCARISWASPTPGCDPRPEGASRKGPGLLGWSDVTGQIYRPLMVFGFLVQNIVHVSPLKVRVFKVLGVIFNHLFRRSHTLEEFCLPIHSPFVQAWCVYLSQKNNVNSLFK